MTDPFLRRALDLARQAAGGVAPRPPVGAVVVKDGKLVGEGRTQARPGHHAEVAALLDAGGAARGGTLICTLEPHGFKGVSPPCTDASVSTI
jgi:diaminohydroxyphosphoribosylaminopyrimidine deaminase/5-amino-6-(5-phosphoribosylamino)uracil reductase